MNNSSIFLRKAGTGFLLAALCLGIFSSCKDEDALIKPLDSTTAELYNSTVSSLTFTWDKVANAVQYGYELKTEDGTVVAADVTSGTTATFTGLKDDTNYILDVWAYSAYGSLYDTKSAVTSLTARTAAIVPLDTPVLTVSTEGAATISWEAIANASSYSYSCTSENGTNISGTTEETYVTLNGIKTGDYTVSVKAVSGNEAYSDSEAASVTFSYVLAREENWRVNGTVNDGADKTWTATLVAWSDGSYTLKNWYNVEGYDLEFTVNSDGTITVTNNDKTSSGVWVASGDNVDDGWVQLYTTSYGSDYYSYFNGTKVSGNFYCYNYRTSGWYEFTWKAGSGEKTENWRVEGTVNDGAGKTWTATLVAWSDGSYTLKDWYNVEGNDLEFTVNSDGTISATNYYADYYPNIWIASGDEIDYGWVQIYTADGYSSFTGDKTGGEVWLYSYRTKGYYDFVWTGAAESSLIDKIVGTYTQDNSYQFWYNSAWGNYSSTNNITIAKVDDTTVSIEGFVYETSDGGKVINATVDSEKGILTIAPQMVDDWYKLAGQNALTESVTATWSDGVITFGDWSLWYDGYAYAYSTKTVLTKK
jgi:hypothetical protein